MKAGNKVRLKSDATRIGVLSGEYEFWGGMRRLEVIFSDEAQFLPEGALELVNEDSSNPFSMLRDGQYGHTSDLRGALTYYRLSGRLANLIYSMGTTNTDFYAYQYKPVLNFLNSPCGGILIADEVGLGKTIEAGLIWTELRSRENAQRLLVICPSMLCEKWEDELLYRFGIKAKKHNAAETLRELQRVKSGEQQSFSIVASLDGLRPPKGWREKSGDSGRLGGSTRLAQYLEELEGGEPIFDAIIIDEAHKLRNPSTQSAKLGKLLRPLTKSLILLSATPIQLKSEDLFHLLHLLDEDSFPYSYSFNDILAANKPLVELSEFLSEGESNKELILEKLMDAGSNELLANNRQLRNLIQNLPNQERLDDVRERAKLADTIERINLFGSVITRTRKREVFEWRVIRQAIAHKVSMSDVEESFYRDVTKRVREYCDRYNQFEGFILTTPQRQICSSMAAACRYWHSLESNEAKTIEDLDYLVYEESGQEIDRTASMQTLGPLVSELIEIAKQVGDYEVLYKADTKYASLITQVRNYWHEYPDKKIVLFSYFRETLRYLKERLHSDGVSCQILMGGMDKQGAIKAFSEPDGAQILLASEVASEGVDLQFSSLLINYDLPWNPMKVEQRIGRIDRLGQKEPRIAIWNIFNSRTIDDRIYSRLYDRLEIFEQSLGGMESILGDEMKKMSYSLLRHELTPEQEKERIDLAYQAVAKVKRNEVRLEKEAANLVAHGEHIQNKIKAAKELNRYVSGQDIFHYFQDFFDEIYPGCRIIQQEKGNLRFDIELSSEARLDFGEHLVRSNSVGKTHLVGTSGGRKKMYLFQNKIATSQHGIETINQYHPVIQFISAERKSRKTTYYPISAIEIHHSELPQTPCDTYFYHVQRWSARGGIKDTERLVFKVYSMNSSDFYADELLAEQVVTTSAMRGKDWLAAKNHIDGELVVERYGASLQHFEIEFNHSIQKLEMENNDRVDMQVQAVEKYRNRRVLSIEERISSYQAKNKLSMIPAERGKIKEAKKRAQESMFKLEKARLLTSDYRDVSVGIIRVIE